MKYINNLILFLIGTIVILWIFTILIGVAYITLLERIILGSTHKRLGPHMVGIFGLGQPLSDAIKLWSKETILPYNANIVVFFIAPILGFILALISWLIIPVNKEQVLWDNNLGILFFLVLSSLSIYSILISGWASNSKYTLLGSIRSASQLISYEIVLSVFLIPILFICTTLKFNNLILYQEYVYFFIPFLPLFIMFLISNIAELNRAPFDLPEAESELVSGFNTEYSSMMFALFFLAEYSHIFISGFLISMCFIGSYYMYWIKSVIIVSFIIFIRACYPRFRYDQLENLCWKYLLPLSIISLMFLSSITIIFNINN